MYFRPLSTTTYSPNLLGKLVGIHKETERPHESVIPAQWWVFRRPEREASWLTVAQAALQGVSLSAFLYASPFDSLSTGHSSGTFQNYSLTGKKKPSPQNVYWYLDHAIPEPSTCLCPLCPPSPSRVIVRKDGWYPVLTLYLGAGVLNSLSLRNMQHRAGSLGYMFSSCLWPWGDSLGLQMCFPVERLQNFPCDHCRSCWTPAQTAVGLRLGWGGARTVF